MQWLQSIVKPFLEFDFYALLIFGLPIAVVIMLIFLFLNIFQGISDDVKDGGTQLTRERFDAMLRERDDDTLDEDK